MTRKLPVVTIGGTDFYVDVRAEEFREVARSDNRISFDELLWKGDHCELLYDRDTKNVFYGDMDEAAGDPSVQWVKLPPPGELDPVGIRQKVAKLAAFRAAEASAKRRDADDLDQGLDL